MFINTMTPKNKKQQYRSAIQIVNEIMQVIVNGGREGVSISIIARAVGIGHKYLVEKCQKLVDADLLREETGHKKRRYYVTEDGIQFLVMLSKYNSIIQVISTR